MECYRDMLRRASVQQIANFVMYGAESIIEEDINIETTEKDAFNKLIKEMDTCCNQQNEELLAMILEYSITIGDLYFTIGMRAGVKIGIELGDK